MPRDQHRGGRRGGTVNGKVVTLMFATTPSLPLGWPLLLTCGSEVVEDQKQSIGNQCQQDEIVQAGGNAMWWKTCCGEAYLWKNLWLHRQWLDQEECHSKNRRVRAALPVESPFSPHRHKHNSSRREVIYPKRRYLPSGFFSKLCADDFEIFSQLNQFAVVSSAQWQARLLGSCT